MIYCVAYNVCLDHFRPPSNRLSYYSHTVKDKPDSSCLDIQFMMFMYIFIFMNERNIAVSIVK